MGFEKCSLMKEWCYLRWKKKAWKNADVKNDWILKFAKHFSISTHHIYKISSQFFAIIFTTFSIHKIVTEKNSSQFKNWHIAANKTKYFPHELIWQISNFRYSKATLHAKLKSQKTLWKKKLSQILKVCNEIKACTWSEWNPQISLRKAEEITPQNLALSLPYFEFFLCMIVKPGGFMQVTNPWLSMKNLFSLFLSPPRNKATQTIFVMTKVYIFAIAKHHSTASFFFLYWKKNWKNSLPKKEKPNQKRSKKGEGERNEKPRYKMTIFWLPPLHN